MKFLKSEPFEKHLKEALPEHSSSIYVLALKECFERRFLLERLIQSLGIDNVEKVPFSACIEEIDSLNLFSEKKIVIVEEIETIDPKAFSLILPKLKHLPSEHYLIFLGKSLNKTPPTFYEMVKKEAVFLDLSAEKPWDKTARLRRWMLEYVHKKGKTLDPDAKEYLFEQGLSDFSVLIEELNKAFTYIGENKCLHLSDLKNVCHFEPVTNSWNLADAIVWGGELRINDLNQLSASSLFSFSGQLRYYFTVGLKIAAWLEQNTPLEIEKNYPKLRPATLSRYKALGKKLGQSYFASGLKDLLDLEIKARSSKTSLLLTLIATFALNQKVKRDAFSVDAFSV